MDQWVEQASIDLTAMHLCILRVPPYLIKQQAESRTRQPRLCSSRPSGIFACSCSCILSSYPEEGEQPSRTEPTIAQQGSASRPGSPLSPHRTSNITFLPWPAPRLIGGRGPRDLTAKRRLFNCPHTPTHLSPAGPSWACIPNTDHATRSVPSDCVSHTHSLIPGNPDRPHRHAPNFTPSPNRTCRSLVLVSPL